MKRRVVIEEAVGETRAALYEGRRLVELHVDRLWTTSPRAGDTYIAQVKTVDASVAGAWVDIGADAAPALLPFAAQRDMPRLTEGQRIEVKVLRSQATGKGATVRFVAESEGKVGVVKRLNLHERLLERFPDLTKDEASVNAVDEVCEAHIGLPGGGSIMIEQTQALLAIDVDKGASESAAAAANEAAKLIAHQLRLRGLGGLVVIDFPNLRQPKQRKTLEQTLESAFEADPAMTKFNALSRFGVIEMTRAKPDISLDDTLNDKWGEPTIATQSLRALRRLTREAKVSPGAKLELYITQDIFEWLSDAPFDWKADLTDRMGARYSVSVGNAVDVKADR